MLVFSSSSYETDDKMSGQRNFISLHCKEQSIFVSMVFFGSNKLGSSTKNKQPFRLPATQSLLSWFITSTRVIDVTSRNFFRRQQARRKEITMLSSYLTHCEPTACPITQQFDNVPPKFDLSVRSTYPSRRMSLPAAPSPVPHRTQTTQLFLDSTTFSVNLFRGGSPAEAKGSVTVYSRTEIEMDGAELTAVDCGGGAAETEANVYK